MTLLDVVIPGDPVGKGRPRCECRGRKPRLYTPDKTRDWERDAARWMNAAYMDQCAARGDEQTDPITAPVAVTIVAYRRWPKSRGAPSVESEPLCTVGDDVDNIAKACLDALQLAYVITDDRTVVELHASKRWATRGEPRVWVRVREVCDAVV